jgi:ribosomal protein S18 acetylase RimI-like enzyme
MPDLPPIQPATDFPESALCDAFNAAFSDYLIGPPNLRHEDWPAFLRRQGVTLPASRVIADAAGQVQAFALVGRLGPHSRLATMGARPEARGSGAAPQLLDHVLAEARQRGDQRFELEVFARNARALALYKSRGFEPMVELFGFLRLPAPPLAGDVVTPAEVAIDDAAAWLRELNLVALPYQVSADAVLAAPPPVVAWRHGRAQLVFSVRDPQQIGVVSLVDTGPAQDDARALLRTLARRHPESSLRVPQVQLSDLGGLALEAEGCKRLDQHQWLMHLALRG